MQRCRAVLLKEPFCSLARNCKQGQKLFAASAIVHQIIKYGVNIVIKDATACLLDEHTKQAMENVQDLPACETATWVHYKLRPKRHRMKAGQWPILHGVMKEVLMLLAGALLLTPHATLCTLCLWCSACAA